jgi:hypothetical protein
MAPSGKRVYYLPFLVLVASFELMCLRVCISLKYIYFVKYLRNIPVATADMICDHMAICEHCGELSGSIIESLLSNCYLFNI